MQLTIVNPGSDALSFVSGAIAVPAYSSTNVPTGYWIRLYSDVQFLINLRNGNIALNDGATTFKLPDSEDFMKEMLDRLTFDPVRKDFSYTSTQTNAAIWAPASGKKFVITDYNLNIRNNTLGALTVAIFDDTNASSNFLYKGSIESGANYDNVSNLVTPFASAAINRSLKITTSGNLTISGTIQGYETE